MVKSNPFGNVNPLPNPYLADMKPAIISPEKQNQPQNAASSNLAENAKKRVFHPVSESPRKEKSVIKASSTIPTPVVKLSTGFEAPPKSTGRPMKPISFPPPVKATAPSIIQAENTPAPTVNTPTIFPSFRPPFINNVPFSPAKPVITTNPANMISYVFSVFRGTPNYSVFSKS